MAASVEDRTVDEKGRITIPKVLRDRLDLEPGEAVSIQLEDGNIVLVPEISREGFIDRMKGCVDETSATGDPIDPTQIKRTWTEDLPGEQ